MRQSRQACKQEFGCVWLVQTLFTMSFMASDINSTWHLKIFLKKKKKKRILFHIWIIKNNKWNVLDECVCKEKEQGVAF